MSTSLPKFSTNQNFRWCTCMPSSAVLQTCFCQI